MADRLLAGFSARPRFAAAIVRLLRGYIRYSPFAAGKRWLWWRVLKPHFVWNHHRFICRTQFAGRMAGDACDLLQQYLYYFGIWEPNLTHWIVNRLRPGDTFVDVGANIGYYSLLASKLVGPAGSVVALEASPAVFHQLQGNLRLNERGRGPGFGDQNGSLSLRGRAGVGECSTGNIRALNVAVSDRSGVAALFRGPDANSGLSTIIAGEASPNDCQFECDVETAPLAELLTSDDIRAARLIKIDVEGAEWPVVSGMRSILSVARDDLEVIVEVCPARLARQGRSPADILAIFQDARFHAYKVENDYTAEGYLARRPPQPPQRLRTPIEHEVDLIFSRLDAEVLA